MNRRLSLLMTGLNFAVSLIAARADTLTWTGMTGDWAAVENWTNWASPADTRVPAAGDNVEITNKGALAMLSASTPWLDSVTVSNGTLSFSNWDTTLYVTNLTISSRGILTCAGPFTNTAMSNRVNVTCSNLLSIASNGAINVDGKGYAGGAGNYARGHGPGGSSGYWGASYGGAGQNGAGDYSLATNTYGNAMAPMDPGSGGNAGNQASSTGGSGGGAVCVTAVQVVVNGSITANGGNYSGSAHNGGGSGGGIYITCAKITGTNGAVTANAGPTPIKSQGGGAGGGRIAVIYDTAAQAALPVPSISFSAASFSSGGNFIYTPGDIGTLYFPDNYFFSPTNLFTGQWLAPEPVSIAVADWMVSNVWMRFSASTITVTNTLTIAGTNYLQIKLEITNACVVNCGDIQVSGASLVLGAREAYRTGTRVEGLSCATSGPALNCANNLILTNGSRFYVYAGLTNAGLAADYGALVAVGGNIALASNCWIYPAAHSTNGAAVLFRMRNLTVPSYAGFNANSFGYAGGRDEAWGVGVPDLFNGAGYGGAGSMGYYIGNPGGTYGFSNAPTAPGSGARGGSTPRKLGPAGGGSVQIRATDVVAIQGAILANGTIGASAHGGGSSGGGIYITCRTFVGSSDGVLQANGGTGNASPPNGGGGGGGGRIAVWRIFDRSPSAISNSVSGAVGRGGTSSQNTSDPGTIVWGWIVPPSGSIVSVY